MSPTDPYWTHSLDIPLETWLPQNKPSKIPPGGMQRDDCKCRLLSFRFALHNSNMALALNRDLVQFREKQGQ